MKLIKYYIISLLLFGLVSCSKETDLYQGYVDSKMRFISSNNTGLLMALYVKEGDHVRPGDRLFTLENYPEAWIIDEKKAQIANIKAKIEALTTKVEVTEKKYNRRKQLKTASYIDQEELDIATSDFIISKKELIQAQSDLVHLEAQLKNAEWSQKQKNVNANIDATVFDIFYYVNEIVPASRPVLALLTPEDIKIYFFVPETQISRVKLGQKIAVQCDGCRQEFEAKVSYISAKPEYSPPVIYSENTREKLVFQVEARADLKTSAELHPGQPVSIRLKR